MRERERNREKEDARDLGYCEEKENKLRELVVDEREDAGERQSKWREKF